MGLDLNALVRTIHACNTRRFIYQGRQLHQLFLKLGIINSTVTIGNRLLQMYSRCGEVREAWQLFDDMPQKNCFTWNTVIDKYMKDGLKTISLDLFHSMPEKNEYAWNLVVTGFAKAGELEVAANLFNVMPQKNELVWNAMIHGYAKVGQPRNALMLFKIMNSNPLEMVHRDTYILASVIGASTDLQALDCGRQVHTRILIDGVSLDPVLCCSLINLYGKCGDLDSAEHALNMMMEVDEFSLSAMISSYANLGRMSDARRIFGSKPNSCIALWNSMISGYLSNCEEQEAISLFTEMYRTGIQADISTVITVLIAISSLGNYEHVKQMHTHALKIGVNEEVTVASALLDAYAKCHSHYDACKFFTEVKAYDTILLNTMITIYSNCGRIEDAKSIFKSMTNRTLISWNSLIVGLSQNGSPIEALYLFCQMNKLDLEMDKFSLASAISACGSISSVDLGEQIFCKATVLGLETDRIVSTSLVDLYCKCGFIETGRKIFDKTMKCDEVSWNTMLMGYARNGRGVEALKLFDEMRHADVNPSAITFIGVLWSCDHCGLVEEGRKWFGSMKWEYDIDPSIEHYSCMIDLLSRAGCIDEAMDVMHVMPFEADASMWSSVLRGCVAHGYKTLAKMAAEKTLELDPGNSGAYVQLSNVFATHEDWKESEQVRELMRNKVVQKSPGCSWAEC